MIEGQVARDRLLGVKALKPIGFEDFGKVFIDHAKANVKAWDRYETSLGNLTPFFGNVNLTAIDPESIERFKKARVEEVKPATVNRDLQVLRRMFNLAIIWGHARENPVKYVKFLREPNGRIRYLTREEFKQLLDELPGQLEPMVIVAVHTGMRLGELLALNWGDVDLENGFLSINDPKEKRAAKMPLNQTARATLEEIYRNALSVRVFVGSDGHPLPERTVEWQFKRALRAAKIQDFHFHDLRHTCATWMVMAGVTLRKVKDILRHKDIRTTMRYAHLAPDDIADAVRILDEFSRSKPKRGM